MARVLVTGMSGTGKSTVLIQLAERGHQIVDADDDGWSQEFPTADGLSREQLWREDRMDALLAGKPSGSLFIAGCASNQGRFYDRFDAVVLLSVPVEVLLERLASRDTSDFGKDPAERARILQTSQKWSHGYGRRQPQNWIRADRLAKSSTRSRSSRCASADVPGQWQAGDQGSGGTRSPSTAGRKGVSSGGGSSRQLASAAGPALSTERGS